jgi:hypothetical protein
MTRGGSYAAAVHGGVLVAGAGGRVTLFDRGGRRRRSIRIGGVQPPVFTVSGRYAFVQPFGRRGHLGATRVVDLRSGRIVAVTKRDIAVL